MNPIDKLLGPEILRDDFTLYSFGGIAILVDQNRKLACLAVCIDTAESGGPGPMLARFTGRLAGFDQREVRDRLKKQRLARLAALRAKNRDEGSLDG